MCETFYKQHSKCSCLYILAKFIPCTAYSHPEPPPSNAREPPSPTISNPFADPEDPFADPISRTNSPRQATRPKLLTYKHEGIDFTHNGVDFVSNDVDKSIAPKGLQCPLKIIATLIGWEEGEDGRCALCEVPDALAVVELNALRGGEGGGGEVEEQKMLGKQTETGKGKSIFHKTARMGSAAAKALKSAAGGRGKKEGTIVGEGESSKEGEEGGSKGLEDKKKKKRERPVLKTMMDPSIPIGLRPMIGP